MSTRIVRPNADLMIVIAASCLILMWLLLRSRVLRRLATTQSAILEFHGHALTVRYDDRERRFELSHPREIDVYGVGCAPEVYVGLTTTVGTRVFAVLPDIEQAHALLTAAGTQTGKQAVRVLLGGPGPWTRWLSLLAKARRHAFVVPLVIAGIAMTTLTATFWLGVVIDSTTLSVLLAPVLLAQVYFGRRGADVVVGSDGVLLRSGAYRRFLPYRSIATVHEDGEAVVLTGSDGARYLLPFPAFPIRDDSFRSPLSAIMFGARGDPEDAVARRRALAQQLDAALENWRLRGADASSTNEVPSVLASCDRALEDWRAAVRNSTLGDYRKAKVEPELAAAIAEDPHAPPISRVGAALAVATSGNADLVDRVRIAAEGCADPNLRTALTKAAADQLDASELDAVALSPNPPQSALRAPAPRLHPRA
jgi:hypothetical protein